MRHVSVFVNIFLRNFLKRSVLNFFKTTDKNPNSHHHFHTPITLTFQLAYCAFRCLFCDGSRTIASTQTLCNPFRENTSILFKNALIQKDLLLYRSATLSCDNSLPDQLHSLNQGTPAHADAAFLAGYLIYVADHRLPPRLPAPQEMPLDSLHT